MFKSFRFTLFAVLILAATPAWAVTPLLLNKSATVSTASTNILPVNVSRTYLLIENVCAENIGISLDSHTAVIGAAGTVTLLPGGAMEFKDDRVPQNAFNAISASGSCGVTIWEIQ